MEGIPIWFMSSILAVYGLIGLCLVPALVALGFLFAGRPRQALTWFAAALLGAAVAWAIFLFLLLAVSVGRGDGEHLLQGLPIGFIGLSVLLAGAGQFIAALRSPRTYAVVLAVASAAMAVVVAGTPITYSFFASLNVPSEWLNMLPDWKGFPVAVVSLLIAMGSLMLAVFLPVGSRDP